MSQLAIAIATQKAKAERAWYLKCVRSALGVDIRTSRQLYDAGIIPACFPVPATRNTADISIDWMYLSMCPYTDGPCLICIEKYIDSIEYVFFPD